MSGCSSALRCKGSAPHMPLCWKDIKSTPPKMCYTEQTWRPHWTRSKYELVTHQYSIFSFNQQFFDGMAWESADLIECVEYAAEPCASITAINHDHELGCLELNKPLEEQDQAAQRVYRGFMKDRPRSDNYGCGGLDVGHLLDSTSNDLQYAGGDPGMFLSCGFNRFGRDGSCWYDADYLEKNFFHADCLIGARCVQHELRGDCPSDMYCEDVEGQTGSACFYRHFKDSVGFIPAVIGVVVGMIAAVALFVFSGVAWGQFHYIATVALQGVAGASFIATMGPVIGFLVSSATLITGFVTTFNPVDNGGFVFADVDKDNWLESIAGDPVFWRKGDIKLQIGNDTFALSCGAE